jgi:hypothetical protein
MIPFDKSKDISNYVFIIIIILKLGTIVEVVRQVPSWHIHLP